MDPFREEIQKIESLTNMKTKCSLEREYKQLLSRADSAVCSLDIHVGLPDVLI